MTLTDYARSLRERWIAILALFLIGGVLGYLTAQLMPHQYKSEGSVLVSVNRGDSTLELTQGSTFVQAVMPSYVVMATSDVVLQPVIDDLNLGGTTSKLSQSVTASTPLNTAVIDITVVEGSASEAQRVAAAVMDSLSKAIPKASPHTAKGTSSVTATTIQNASLPVAPFAPSTRLYMMLGAIIGLAVGAVYAWLRRLFGDRISETRDVAELTTLPLLGQILETKRNVEPSRQILHDPLGPVAESVRALAANLNFLRVDGGLRSFVITSAEQGEGKSTLALSLSLVIAESGKRVLLIDADLRRPSIARNTQLEGSVGLTNVLLEDVELKDAVEQWGDPNLTVLTSGPIPPNPAQLLSSRSMADLVAATEREFDLVIIDSAPILGVSDTIWLSHAGSGALLVARRGRTSRRKLTQALVALEHAESTVLGVALTRAPRRGTGRYTYTGDAPDTTTTEHAAAATARRSAVSEVQETTRPSVSGEEVPATRSTD